MNQHQRQSWRTWLDRHFIALFMVVSLMAVVIILIAQAYRMEWNWTGLVGIKPDPTHKTAWDWMDLLIVPLVLVVGAYLFNRAERKSDREIAERRHQEDQEIAAQRYQHDLEIAADSNQETLLSTYLDRMSELLTRGQLRDDSLGVESRHIARARTLTALRNLNPPRKSTIIQFLSDSSLTDGKILDLSNASLADTDLIGANLPGSNLTGVNLCGADLTVAHLGGADLTFADLSGAKLPGSDLRGANLTEANLDRADLTDADLRGANLAETSLAYADLSGADLSQAALNEAYLVQANLTGANLTGADLTGADLRFAQNLTFEQLSSVKTLYGIHGLVPELKAQVKEQCPHLLLADAWERK